jgi:protein gp37
MTTGPTWNEAKKWNAKSERAFNAWEGMAKELGGEVDLIERGFTKPLRPMVFVNSLADFFEDFVGPIVNHRKEQVFFGDASGDWRTVGTVATEYPVTMNDMRSGAFNLFDATPFVNYLLVTKRPENIPLMWKVRPSGIHQEGMSFSDAYYRQNVWLGTSCENQEYADKRIPKLLKARGLSPVLFLSCEPLLSGIEFSDVTKRSDAVQQLGKKALSGIDWCIGGCESGADRRPASVEWFRSIREQCRNAGVPYFHKQMEVGGKVTTNMDEFPIDLRIQEYPIGRDR